MYAAIVVIACGVSDFSHAGMTDCVNDKTTSPIALEGEHPIRRLMACANTLMGVTAPYWVEFSRYGKAECSSALREAQQSARQCADDRVVAAVESAKGKDDLKAAVKDYYIKQKAYVDSWGPNPGQTVIGYKSDLAHAQAAADSAWDKVMLEGKLVGVPLGPPQKAK